MEPSQSERFKEITELKKQYIEEEYLRRYSKLVLVVFVFMGIGIVGTVFWAFRFHVTEPLRLTEFVPVLIVGCLIMLAISIGAKFIYRAVRNDVENPRMLSLWFEGYRKRDYEKKAESLRTQLRMLECLIPIASEDGFSSEATEKLIRAANVLRDHIPKLRDVYYDKTQQTKWAIVGINLDMTQRSLQKGKVING